MQQPNVCTTYKDPRSGITYHVMAYRQVTKTEMAQAIHAYHAKKKKRQKAESNTVITIITIIGHDQ